MKVPENRALLHRGYAPNGSRATPPLAINLKGHWLKDAGFETGFIFTVKILNGCLVLIPDSEDIRAMKQQKQQQQAQLSEVRLRLCELTMEYSND
ncbi:SymE family type I addiction module toxin [Providencia stuartii]|uniref:SymE family type I addiction module toxin n=1 Tax=Providencia TaxID=586 RepID=UPI0029406D45|nr:SymE family type I addiction module toxin [Providencia sp. 2023EL-00965]ELR5300422.1 SymE family type I addiction module toxin [Providencia stuartii]MDW7588056.1 SymE family type I addiction module toxin [Providencia sp. 2023EL-00965]